MFDEGAVFALPGMELKWTKEEKGRCPSSLQVNLYLCTNVGPLGADFRLHLRYSYAAEDPYP